MRISGIDQSVKRALFKGFPELVAELIRCRMLDEVFPSVKREIYQDYFERESIDDIFREIVFYTPFNSSIREDMEGVEFRLYFDGYNGKDLSYAVEIVMPSYLGDRTVGADRTPLGTVLLEYVTEQVSDLVPADDIDPIFYMEEYDNHCYGYKVMFDIK